MGVKSRCPFSSRNPRRHAHFAVKQRDFYLTQLSSILEPLQEKTEPRQGENINPPTMISKLFIVMTAVVVAVNAQGNSTSTSTADSSLGSASGLNSCALECLTCASTVDGCVTLYVLS